MGAADEEQLLSGQVRHDADVILALVLKGRKCEIFLFTGKGINGDVVRRGAEAGRLRPGANLN